MEEEVDSIAASLGFAHAFKLKELGGAQHYWSRQPSSYFTLEALCFTFSTKSKSRRLQIEFLASPLSPSELNEFGLGGNGILESLFEYQYSMLGLAPGDILPNVIRLGSAAQALHEESEAQLIRSMKRELDRCHKTVWEWLRQAWLGSGSPFPTNVSESLLETIRAEGRINRLGST